jgi:hypothetical protein
MAFVDAERSQLWLRCALFGPSGSGKTMTALRMAKGIAEKTGVPYAVIDTEARSASKYADRFKFKVDNLAGKTIDHYLASLKTAQEMGYKVVVIDSLSHAWRELTDEVDRIAQSSSSKNTFSPWAKVNPKQKRFIDAILNFPGHIIATMRSNTEWVVKEGNGGKNRPERIGLKPEQGKGIEFEFDLLLELDQNHQAAVIKDRTGKYQDETIDKPGEEFGVALYEWLMDGKALPAPAVVKPADTAMKPDSKPAANTKTAAAKPASPKSNPFKMRGDGLIQEIGKLFTALDNEGNGYFSEDEKAEGRSIIASATLDEKGIKELGEFKDFIAEELLKRQGVKAA